jgi:hypothetical protein
MLDSTYPTREHATNARAVRRDTVESPARPQKSGLPTRDSREPPASLSRARREQLIGVPALGTLTRVGSFRLLDVLSDVPELENATSEKGRAIVNDDWEPASVFGLVSALAPETGRESVGAMRTLVHSPDLVLCTDLGTEVADFVLTTSDRVVFVHA